MSAELLEDLTTNAEVSSLYNGGIEPSSFRVYLPHGREVRQEVEITNSPVNQQFSKMHRVVETVAEYIAQRFKVLENVRAVLVGRSGEVHHVWIMLSQWTADHRKAVYAIQKDILSKLKDINLDFYVIDIPEGMRPDEMVSSIPVIFCREDAG